MQLLQGTSLTIQRLRMRMQTVFILLTFGDQNTVRMITVFVPNDCQDVGSDMRLRSGRDDGPIGGKLWEVIISRQDMRTAALNFVFSIFI